MVAGLILAGCARYQPRPLSPGDSAARLEARTLENPTLKEFLERNSGHLWTNWPPETWNFEALNLAALFYHPSLDVARAQWQVASGEKTTAAARPNPTLSAVPGYDINAASGISPWFPAVTFDLPLETAGKRGYRMAHARHLSESARLNMLAASWQVRSSLRLSLIEFTTARQREALLQKQKSIQERIIRALEQQVQAGAASSAELTSVQIALSRLRLDLLDAQQQSAEARTRVAESVGVPSTALGKVELTYDAAPSAAKVAGLTSAAVRQKALETRADILSSLAEYAAAQSALQLEVAKQYPDVHLGPGYQYDQGDHKLSLSLTVELPILNQNQGPIAQAEARRTEAAARFNALQAKIIAEIDRAAASFQAAQESLASFESLVTAQENRRSLLEAQAKAGAATEFDLLNAQLELAASEMLQLNGRFKWLQSLGALEDAVQQPLDSMLTALAEPPPRSLSGKGKP